MNRKKSKQLCPTCKTGQDTYLLDSRNPFCPHLHCYNGKTCTAYVPLENTAEKKDIPKTKNKEIGGESL